MARGAGAGAGAARERSLEPARSGPARGGGARGDTIWGTKLRELLEAELPSGSPARTGSRYLAMPVRALLGTA
jgi:hypothetical protein